MYSIGIECSGISPLNPIWLSTIDNTYNTKTREITTKTARKSHRINLEYRRIKSLSAYILRHVIENINHNPLNVCRAVYESVIPPRSLVLPITSGGDRVWIHAVFISPVTPKHCGLVVVSDCKRI